MSVPILRPWPHQLAVPKQVKPQGIPQIDWSHPLTLGLISYWYDTGLGYYMDLVTGDTTVVGAGSTFPNVDGSPYGTGFKFNQVGPRVIAARNNFPIQTFVAPYSFVTSFYQHAAPSVASAGMFMVATDATGAVSPNYFYHNPAGDIRAGFGDVTVSVVMSDPTPGNFYTIAGVATGASAEATYAFGTDGTFRTTTAAIATGFSGSGLKAVFNGFGSAGTDVANIGSAIFCGAFWNGRALTQDEVQLLYTDPYCFLIPAEPELQALPYNIGGGIVPPRTIMRPWPNQLATPKQMKPQGVPQIDWGHPLAQSLISYWYDTGLGFYIDLVTGDTTVLGSGSTFPTSDAGPYGTGFKFSGGPQVIQASKDFQIQNWAWPYSAACGFLQLGVVGGVTAPTYFGIEQSTNNSIAIQFYSGGGVGFFVAMSDEVDGINLGSTPTSGFHVAVGVADGALHSTGYLDGILKGVDTRSTAFSPGVNMKAVFNGFGPNSTNVNYCNAQVFFGAVWTRVLEAEEAKLLYTDPYCLLIPAEPEMSLLFSPNMNLMPQIWM